MDRLAGDNLNYFHPGNTLGRRGDVGVTGEVAWEEKDESITNLWRESGWVDGIARFSPV